MDPVTAMGDRSLMDLQDQLLEADGCVSRSYSAEATSCSSNSAVKWKTLPTLDCLSNQILPPIISTIRAQIVNPEPVPPYRRVVDPSACVFPRVALGNYEQPGPVIPTAPLACAANLVRLPR